MPKIIIKNQLKKGESFIGELDEVSNSNATFKDKKDNVVKLPLPSNILTMLDEDYYSGDIVKITNGDDWELETLEEWPQSKDKD